MLYCTVKCKCVQNIHPYVNIPLDVQYLSGRPSVRLSFSIGRYSFVFFTSVWGSCRPCDPDLTFPFDLDPDPTFPFDSDPDHTLSLFELDPNLTLVLVVILKFLVHAKIFKFILQYLHKS